MSSSCTLLCCSNVLSPKHCGGDRHLNRFIGFKGILLVTTPNTDTKMRWEQELSLSESHRWCWINIFFLLPQFGSCSGLWLCIGFTNSFSHIFLTLEVQRLPLHFRSQPLFLALVTKDLRGRTSIAFCLCNVQVLLLIVPFVGLPLFLVCPRMAWPHSCS